MENFKQDTKIISKSWWNIYGIEQIPNYYDGISFDIYYSFDMIQENTSQQQSRYLRMTK